MNIYVDSSALVKMAIGEADSPALARYFAEFSLDRQITAAISRPELVRAVARRGATVDTARKALSKLDFAAITNNLLDAAAALAPPELRTLDAIHLSAALSTPDLRVVVTYDRRLAEAAEQAGLPVVSPA